MTWAVGLIALGGLGLTALVTWFGAQAIGHEVLEAWWVVPAALALHAGQLGLSARAWGYSIGRPRPRLTVLWRVRWIREAVNSMLPVAQLGGNLVGVRLLTQRGVPGALAGAATTLDITLEAISQLLFVLLGVGVLAALDHERAWAPWLGGGLATMALGIAGFIAAQRIGLLRVIEALAARLSRVFPGLSPDMARGLHSELLRRQRDHAALLRAGALQFAAWLVGVAETWLALAAMGRPVPLAQALVIESLGMAARSAGFAVPGALGVQEAGFILACDLFAIPADTAIALSMVKRARELLAGAAGLAVWQGSELRRLLRRAARDKPAGFAPRSLR